jgi:hypothetical protein
MQSLLKTVLKTKNLALVSLPFLLASSAYAQFNEATANKIGTLITTVNSSIVGALATLFIALAVTAFFWGIIEFIVASRSGESKAMENGKQFMLWSVIALFVMFSIYGIIKFGQGILFPGYNLQKISIPGFEINGTTSGTPSTPGTGPGDAGPGTNTGTGDILCANKNEGDECASGKVCAKFTVGNTASLRCVQSGSSNPGNTGNNGNSGSGPAYSCSGKTDGTVCYVNGDTEEKGICISNGCTPASGIPMP